MTQQSRTTSGEIPYPKNFIDRETGQEKQIIIQSTFDDVVVSSSSLSVTTELTQLSLESFIAFLKCFLTLQELTNLPEKALQEASEELEGILKFYSDYMPKTTNNTLKPPIIKGKIMPAKTRPPIVLDA